MIDDLLKEGYDNEDYTENIMVSEKSCCQGNHEASKTCGCQKPGIPIKK